MDPLALIRAVHFAACILLLAGPVFLLVTLPPDLRMARAGEDLRERLDRLLGWAAFVALVSGGVDFALVVQSLMGETEIGLWPLLSQTQLGHLFLLRLGLMGAVLVVAQWGGRPGWLAGLAVALLGSLAWAGHAAAGEGTPCGAFVDVVHLLAAGIWPGGLVPLALYLSMAPAIPDEAGFLAVARTVRRFSRLSIAAVAALAASGAGNACLILGGLGPLWTTTYGRLLVAKLVLFLALMAVAATNLLFLAPRLRSGTGRSLPALRRNVWIELGLGAAVLLVVGFLGMASPG